MQATCSCHTLLCRRRRQTGSSNGKARSTLQSRWALVLTPTWMQMSPRATVPGYRQSRRPRSPASRNGTGHLPFANRAGCKRAEIVLDAHGSCEQAGPVGWGERVTCDELIQFPVTWAARGEPTSRASGWAGCFGREGTPDICPGRPRGAGRGPGRHSSPGAPSLHHRNSARISWMVLENGGFLMRECPGGGTSHCPVGSSLGAQRFLHRR